MERIRSDDGSEMKGRLPAEWPMAARPRIEHVAIGPNGVPEISGASGVLDPRLRLTEIVQPSGSAPVLDREVVRTVLDDRARADGDRRPGDAGEDGLDAATESHIMAAAADTEAMHRWPFVERRERPRDNERIERAINVVLASSALVVAAPAMALVALALRITSPGPVLYSQDRVGKDTRSGRDRRRAPLGDRSDRRHENVTGRIFTIYKFRTMCVDAECGRGAVWAQKDDPRVTRLGRVLRRTRLDELPQLWNVLRGDMNIVGPRPERPQIITRLVPEIREYFARHRARPGITGLAQIEAAYDSSIEDVKRKVRYDLEYLEQRSLWMDVKIMAKTIPVMLRKKLGW